jgi:hypothetical protein
MLVTLKLSLADGRERHISYEIDDQDESSAREILHRASEDGRVRLGDREEYPLEGVQRVEFVREETRTAPQWIEQGMPPGAVLRDEGVADALREDHHAHRVDTEAAD